MKKTFILAFISLGLIVSCNKSQVVAPASEAMPAQVFKDNHIALTDVKLAQTGAASVAVSFTTRYEAGINKIEVMSGKSKSNFCSIYEKVISGESHSLKTYNTTDENAAATSNYYLIRYLTTNGDWTYSPVYEIKMK